MNAPRINGYSITCEDRSQIITLMFTDGKHLKHTYPGGVHLADEIGPLIERFGGFDAQDDAQ